VQTTVAYTPKHNPVNYFKNKEGAAIVRCIVRTIQANKDYLGSVDGEIGDGDHGVNMNKGFTMAGERLEDGHTFSEACRVVAQALMEDIGGSMGPLYGSFFKALWRHSKSLENISAENYGTMLQAATEAVMEIGGAKVGDKSLIDTLVPAYQAFQCALADKADFTQALQRSTAAAEAGKESTRALVAKIGRSARLGERSRGVLDAGAVSSFLILQALHGGIAASLQD